MSAIKPGEWPDRGFVYSDGPERWWAECAPCLRGRFSGGDDPLPDMFGTASEAGAALRQHLRDVHYALCPCGVRPDCPSCNGIGFVRRDP